MQGSVHAITLNGVIYPIDQLPDRSSLLDEQDRAVVEFIHAWKEGKNDFQLKTSGSTGTPKAIVITRNQMKASAKQTSDALSLKRGFTALLCLDARYIAGQMMLVRCLEVGMNVVAVRPSANPFEQLESNAQIDFAAFVPYQLQHILESDQAHRLNKLKCVITGGASLDRAVQVQLEKFSCDFYATYGMTETVSHIALQKLNGKGKTDSFQVLPEVKISIDDRNCLVAEADYILNQKVITNDVVEILSPKTFRWLGRFDNIINSAGIKIFPEQVEKTIEQVFSTKMIGNRFFVTPQKDAHLGERIVLIMEGKSPHDHKTILQFIKEALPNYQNPKDIFEVENFVDTDTGKINRRETLLKIPHLAPQS